MKKGLLMLLVFLAVFLIIYGCASRPQRPEGLEGKATTTSPEKESAPPVKGQEDWEVKWNETLAKAKKEGRVSVYSSAGADTRIALTRAFKNKYGINVEFVSGRAPQLTERIITERRAELYVTDMLISGVATMYSSFKPFPAKILESLEDSLILPEVKDPKMWWDGRLPLIYKGNQVLTFTATVNEPFTINNQVLKKEELASYYDLLNPKWKDKIIWSDPTLSGSGSNFFVMLAHKILGIDYFRKLAELNPYFTRDQRLQVEMVTRGRYPIAIGASSDNVIEFMKIGAPIEKVVPKEGSYLSSSGGNIMFLSNAPHPNAARIFFNFLASKEGQDIWTEYEGVQSARVDVSTTGLSPGSLRQAGVKYYSIDDEEIQEVKGEYWKLAAEMFGIK